MSDDKTRTAHWGSCSDADCGTAMIIYPHPFAGHDLPPEIEWEDSLFYIDCPVCGLSMDWGGTDPAEEIIRNY